MGFMGFMGFMGLRGFRGVRVFRGLRGLRGLIGMRGLTWLLYINCEVVGTPLGIGYMALWGCGAKCVIGWVIDDTP